MASNKIHLGNTKIVSDSEAPEGTIITTPTKSGTMALLSDLGGGGSSIDAYTRDEIDSQQAAQDAKINKNASDIAALEAEGSTPGDVYTKEEIDDQQDLQDIEIAENATNITNNAIAIAKNAEDIAKNTKDISEIPAPIDTYNKAEIDSQQKAQDDVTATKADKVDVYTKVEINAQQSEQDAEIAKKADKKDTLEEAPEDGETYARNNKTWVSISETSGIPDAPVDGKMYGRKDGEWDAVADAGDIYTKAQIDSQQSAQDTKIDKNKTDIAKNTADIAAIPAPVDAYTKAEVDASQLAQDTEIAKKADKETTYTKAQIDSQQSAQDVKIDKNIDDIQTNADAIAAIPAPIDSYTKAEVDASQNEQDTEILKKADKADVYTKTEMDTQQSAQDTKIDKNVSDVAKNTADITKYTADVAKNTSDIAENKKDIAQNTEDIAAMPPYVDAYTKTETNTLLDAKADKGESYTKAEIDASQAAQDEAIAALSDQEAITYKGSINATNTGAPVDANVGDMYINDFNPAEPNTVYPVAEYGDWGMVTEVKYNDKLIKVAGGWDKIEAPQIPDVVGPDSPFKFYGTTAVSTPAPYDPVEGQMMFNKVEGYPDPSWGIDTDLLIPVDAVLIYELMTPGKWGVIQAPSNADDVIKEAPKDGKQYARQDGDWSEVEATSGGGGEAQPPVAFNAQLKTPTELPNLMNSVVPLESINLDTDNAWKGDHYLVPKDGIYSLQASTYISDVVVQAPLHQTATLITRVDTGDNSTILARHSNYVGTGSEATKDHGPRTNSTPVSVTCELKKGDKIQVEAWARTHSGGNFEVSNTEGGRTFLSGHMISSITEGEVKEKEPVVFRGQLSVDQTISSAVMTKVKIDTIYTDNEDNKLGNDADFDSVNNRFKPSVAGYYQVSGAVRQSCSPMSTQTVATIFKNGYNAVAGSESVSTTESARSSVSGIVYLDGKEDYLELHALLRSSGTCAISSAKHNTFFSAHLITGQSSGGSGGGDYTPEKMVWEDKTADRVADTVYTNTNEVPLYVQLYVNSPVGSLNYADFYIDGERVGASGANANDGRIVYDNPLYIVPAGSTYELRKGGNPELSIWREARMPVAVGTGGGGKGLVQDKGTWNITNAGDSTGVIADSQAEYIRIGSLVQVWGQFQVGETFTSNGIGGLPFTVGNPTSASNMLFNGVITREGLTKTVTVTAQKNSKSIVFYEHGGINSGNYLLDKNTQRVRFSLTYITDEAPVMGDLGDSIWTEEDGKAVYDGDVNVNGVTVGAGSGDNASNVALGLEVLSNSTGMDNVAVGGRALKANTTGSRNTAIGRNALGKSLTGSNNTALGLNAGFENALTGSNNTLIGYNAQPSAPTVSNEVTIGDDDVSQFRVPALKLAIKEYESGVTSLNTYSSTKLGLAVGGKNHIIVNNSGIIEFPEWNTWNTTSALGNLHISASGQLYKSTTAMYSAEEVDKKLAVKDKLIEKLSARLDKLEKRLKK